MFQVTPRPADITYVTVQVRIGEVMYMNYRIPFETPFGMMWDMGAMQELNALVNSIAMQQMRVYQKLWKTHYETL